MIKRGRSDAFGGRLRMQEIMNKFHGADDHPLCPGRPMGVLMRMFSV